MFEAAAFAGRKPGERNRTIDSIDQKRSTRARVLVLRCCRTPQFAAAVQLVRRRYPDADIVALSHAGHAESLLAAGVDRVIELPGTRFGLLRLGPFLLRRLRAVTYDEVV